MWLSVQVYNFNVPCICWSNSIITKGLQHVQTQENVIHESVTNDFVSISHVNGKNQSFGHVHKRRLRHISFPGSQRSTSTYRY